jgi:hypothetical protein
MKHRLRNHLGYSLLGLAVAFTGLAVFVGVVEYSTYTADTIRTGSLICSDAASFDEASEALAQGDDRWLGSVRGCVATNQPVSARVVSCRIGDCRVRAWAEDGYTSVVYVARTSLFH